MVEPSKKVEGLVKKSLIEDQALSLLLMRLDQFDIRLDSKHQFAGCVGIQSSSLPL